MPDSALSRIASWAPHAASAQRRDLAEAVAEIHARLAALEARPVATTGALETLARRIDAVDGRTPHVWALIAVHEHPRALAGLAATAEGARSLVAREHTVLWADPTDATVQVGRVAPPHQAPQVYYRVERLRVRE